ncbi:MAG: 30S ribosomal protein S5 [Patescibacteria group bacterium]
MNKRRGGSHGGHREEKKEFDQRIIDIARVTRVMAGGKRMRFRACVAIGDHKGRVGVGIAKGADVSAAITKAVHKAKKSLVNVVMINDTIPHIVKFKFKAAVILLKPAPKGSGVIAGGAIRSMVELAGIKNIVSKMLGSDSKINNVQATIGALHQLKDQKMLRDRLSKS